MRKGRSLLYHAVGAAGRTPAGVAPRAHRNWRGVLRLLLALCIVSLVVAGFSGLWAGLEGSRTRSALDAAGRENRELRVRQDNLRERSFDLAGRLEELEHEQAVVRVIIGDAQAPVAAPARR